MENLNKDLIKLHRLYNDLLKKVTLMIDQGKVVYPKLDEILRCLTYKKLSEIKVVIIGQDPYHGEGQANGLAFDVTPGQSYPPSLKNILKEIQDDLDVPDFLISNFSLEDWARQGVILLNRVLTVEKDKPKAHSKIVGWEEFTDLLVKLFNNYCKNIVFILWGSEAGQLKNYIDVRNHLVLTSAHPSPLSANKGFFGCKHFSKTNYYLKEHKKDIIKWI